MNTMNKKLLRKVLNVLLAAIIFYEWYILSFNSASMQLGGGGFKSLRYFTILSNMLEAFACLYYCLTEDDRFKYPAAVSLGLTFTVVICFLGPLYGYGFMYAGANLWLHLIVPLISIGGFIILNKKEKTAKDDLKAVIPMVIYGICYLANVLVHDRSQFPNPHDWYGFTMWGLGAAILIFAILIATTYLLGFVLRKVNKAVITKQAK